MPTVHEGDAVRVHYTVRLLDGTLIHSSLSGEPLAFHAGSDEVIPGLSHGVLGMSVGETRRVRVGPEEGFGAHDPALARRVKRELVPGEVEVGSQLEAVGQGKAMAVWVRSVDADWVLLDGNHPLAGLTLDFEIALVECVDSDAFARR